MIFFFYPCVSPFFGERSQQTAQQVKGAFWISAPQLMFGNTAAWAYYSHTICSCCCWHRWMPCLRTKIFSCVCLSRGLCGGRRDAGEQLASANSSAGQSRASLDCHTPDVVLRTSELVRQMGEQAEESSRGAQGGCCCSSCWTCLSAWRSQPSLLLCLQICLFLSKRSVSVAISVCLFPFLSSAQAHVRPLFIQRTVYFRIGIRRLSS